MKRVLILTRFRDEYEPQRLKEEALKLNFGVDVVNYTKIRVGQKNGQEIIDLGTGKDMLEYDLIIPRASSARGKVSSLGIKTKILKSLQNEKEVKVLNGESFERYPLLGKQKQGASFKKKGLPAVDFRSFSASKWGDFLNEEHQFPFIFKMHFGSHGKNVKLVENEAQLKKLSIKYQKGEVLIQPVLKVRRWFRVIVLGGKVLGIMKHRQKDKYQTEELKEITRRITPSFTEDQITRLKDICLAACEIFACDYAGLDVAWDEDKKDWVIWELNRTAQFKWFEKANPEINVAKEICLWGEKE